MVLLRLAVQGLETVEAGETTFAHTVLALGQIEVLPGKTAVLSSREAGRAQTLIALEALTDFEAWGLMRERHGLSFEAACDLWIDTIDKLLPPTPPMKPPA